jgi:hypothetical protein
MNLFSTLPRPAAVLFAAAGFSLGLSADVPSVAPLPTPTAIPLASSSAAIALGQMTYLPDLDRLVVPLGAQGGMALVDAATRRVTLVPGFPTEWPRRGDGVTCAGEGDGRLFALDRRAAALLVLDPRSGRPTVVKPMAADSECLVFSANTREIWVSQPARHQIEILAFLRPDFPNPVHRMFVPVAGEIRALLADTVQPVVYVLLGQPGMVVALDARSHQETGRWDLGCRGGSQLALDAERGLLFASCDNRDILTPAASRSGLTLGRLAGVGEPVAYSATKHMLYAWNDRNGTLAIVTTDDERRPAVLARSSLAPGARSAALDRRGQLWITDPAGARLLLFPETTKSP